MYASPADKSNRQSYTVIEKMCTAQFRTIDLTSKILDYLSPLDIYSLATSGKCTHPLIHTTYLVKLIMQLFAFVPSAITRAASEEGLTANTLTTCKTHLTLLRIYKHALRAFYNDTEPVAQPFIKIILSEPNTVIAEEGTKSYGENWLTQEIRIAGFKRPIQYILTNLLRLDLLLQHKRQESFEQIITETFHVAARCGDIKTLKSIVSNHGHRTDQPGKIGITQLLNARNGLAFKEAAHYGFPETITWLFHGMTAALNSEDRISLQRKLIITSHEAFIIHFIASNFTVVNLLWELAKSIDDETGSYRKKLLHQNSDCIIWQVLRAHLAKGQQPLDTASWQNVKCSIQFMVSLANELPYENELPFSIQLLQFNFNRYPDQIHDFLKTLKEQAISTTKNTKAQTADLDVEEKSLVVNRPPHR